MKKYKKKLGACMALILTAVVALCAVLNQTQISYAQETFTQVSDMVSEKVRDKEDFVILEIVDTLDEASIGYLVDGQEPYALNLSGMDNQQLQELIGSLRESGLLAPDDTDDQASYPLMHEERTEYQYSEIPDNSILFGQGYRRLNNQERTTVSGRFIAQPAGVLGFYALPADADLNDAATAQALLNSFQESGYRTSGTEVPEAERIVAYLFVSDSLPEATVTPEQTLTPTVTDTVTPTDTITPTDTTTPGEDITPTDTTTPGEDITPTPTDTATPGADIAPTPTDTITPGADSSYRIGIADGQEILLAYSGNNLADVSGLSGDGADPNADQTVTPDAAQTITPNADQTDIPNADQTMTSDITRETTPEGTLTPTPAEEDGYVGEGNGEEDTDTETTLSPSPSLDEPSLEDGDYGIMSLAEEGIEGNGYLFTYTYNVIRNNNWFKYYVLGLEEGSSNFDNLNIRVLTFTADGKQTLQYDENGVTNIRLEDALEIADLVYLNGDGHDVTGAATDASNDLSAEFVQKLLSKAVIRQLPVMLNYTEYILDGVHENMRKLVNILLQPDLSAAYGRLSFSGNGDADSLMFSDAFSSEGWQSVANSVSLENHGNFVRENIFCISYQDFFFKNSTYDGNSTVDFGKLPELANGNFKNQFTDEITDGGFAKVYTAILQENYERGQAGSNQATMAEYVTPAVAVSYILNFAGYDPVIYKDTIRVLELQPCRDYTYYYDGDTSTEEGKAEQQKRKLAFAEKWAPAFSENLDAITISGMTTSEFCGKISDVYENYDVIYFGSNTGIMNNKTIGGGLGWSISDTNYTAEDIGLSYFYDSATGKNEQWRYSASEQMWYLTEWVDGQGNVETPAERGPGGSWYNNGGTVWNNSGSTWMWDGTEHCWKVKAQMPSVSFTVYNDESMYGIVYAHTGDTYSLGGYEGLLAANESEVGYRYSGNDILDEQVDELLNFLKSGSPIILASDFVTLDADGNQVANSSGYTTTVREEYSWGGHEDYTVCGILDNSSYVFEFVSRACQEGYSNLLVEDQADAMSMAAALNQQKLTLNMLSVPTEYSYVQTEDALGSIVDCTYLSKESDGKYYLNYEFTISNLSAVTPLTTRYHIQLFLDSNSDGIYNTETEELSDIEVYNAQTGEAIQKVSSPMSSEEGASPVAHYELSANTPYIVRRVLPDGYVGCIGWKLMASQVGNPYIHDSETGLTAVRNEQLYGAPVDPETGKQIIHVLQITSSGSGTLDLEYETTKASGDRSWAILMDSIPDFVIEFDSISEMDFACSFENDPAGEYYDERNDSGIGGYLTGASGYEWSTEHTSNTYGRRNDYLNFYDYDMVIVGFGDDYPNLPSKKATEALVAYGDSGKSLMYTHDTTFAAGVLDVEGDDFSLTGHTSTLSMSIRAQCGMDRYGVSLDRFDPELYAENPIKNGVQIGVNAVIEYNNTHDRQGSDIAFMPNTGQSEMAPQTQALTYTCLGYSANGTYSYLNAGASIRNWKYDGTGNNNRVTQVNSGIITQYPYTIGEDIVVSNTHAQYFQLDLDTDSDGDGRGDVVVWYCISSLDADTDWNDAYDYSPNDVRNNYYIYNKGNITYTGVGHTGNFTIEEMKLFINTFVAAYNAGVRNPDIRIVDGASANAADLESVSIPFDAADTETAGTYRVFYQVKDNNITLGTTDLSICYYIGNLAGADAVKYGGIEISADRFADGELKTYLALTGEEVPYNQIVSGNTYYVDVPLAALVGPPESFDFYVEVDLKLSGTDEAAAWATDKLMISEIMLFDLD